MKLNYDRIFSNKSLLKLMSLLLAVLAWLLVVRTIDSITTRTIKDVTVDVTAQSSKIDPMNLSVVEEQGQEIAVDVLIEGDQGVIGGVRPSELSVVADLTGITQPGTYNNVRLICTDLNSVGATNKRFQVAKITPSMITVKIDRMVTRNFAITTDVEGLLIPDDYVGFETATTPKEVTITGPESEISKINSCGVSAAFTDPLTKNTTVKSDIVLYDSEGNELEKNLFTLSPETADITVPVLKRKKLPVKVDFINVPSGFPIQDLDYKLSQGYINVAGPESGIDAYQDLSIGHINLSEIGLNYVEVFDISLPSGFKNLDNVDGISVEVDTTGMTEANFVVKNIKAVNVPVNYEVSVDTVQISGVHMVGLEEAMENLSAEDLVAEIDISEREVSPGPYNLPVKITAPGKGLVWAEGEYTAVVTIKEK